MNINDFLEKTAYQGDMVIGDETCKVWKSKFDDSYMTHVGLEDELRFLADRGITAELTHGVGFSPTEKKWYGWSHRAIYGFGIGSTCRRGDCHYRAANLNDEIEAAILFWSDENKTNMKAEQVKDGELSVSWEYNNKMPNEKLRGTIKSVSWEYDTTFGKGEWKAKTLEDAKLMAIDFSAGVS